MEEKSTRKRASKSIAIDLDEMQQTPVDVTSQVQEHEHFKAPSRAAEETRDEHGLINCLRNEKVFVKFINRASSITDPRHVLFGRMHENAKKTFVVPRLSSGTFVNVLTNDEKDFLEYILGYEKNAMSVYKKENNFWDDSNENNLASVTLVKGDNVFDLSKPEDYIRVKILLANKDLIAPSYDEYNDRPKASYLYYMTSEVEESRKAISTVSNKSNSYIELGKISNDLSKMRLILEILQGRPISTASKSEYLQVELSKCIEGNAKEFLKVLKDPYLDMKVLIKECHDKGIISKKGDWYVMRSDGSPLCESGEEPTLNIAAKFLASPKHQELLFSLQAKVNM